MPFPTPGIPVVPERGYETELLGNALIENTAKWTEKNV
jgi:hypothetical protein